MSSVPFTFRIDPETKASLEAAAKSSDITPGYLSAHEEKRLAIEAAIAEADKGVFVSSGPVHEWMDAMTRGESPPKPKLDVFLK